MPSTTHPHALHFDRPVDSYWEASADPLGIAVPPLVGDQSCDVAIIGAGFTGLAAALELARSHVDVRVLEAAAPGWGASGRNGGFSCIGSHKLGYGRMIAAYGLDETRRFYGAMRDAIELVRENCSAHGIDAWISGAGELTLAHLPNRVEELRAERDFLARTFGEKTELLDRAALGAIGAAGPGFHGGLRGEAGFGVHPLNYVRGLARAAVQAGAVIHGESRVVRWEERDGGHLLATATGALKARRVIVATNGYTPEEVAPRLAGRLLPALSSIVVTRPLSLAERQEQGWTTPLMAYDSRNLLHYFRLLPDGRFLFGGRGGTDASDAGAAPLKDTLAAALRELFPAWSGAEITHFWRGFVCLAYDLVPYVGALDERRTVWTAIAYHGNGVAMASWCGRAVARLVAGTATPADLPGVIARRLAAFPFPALRPLYLKGAYLWYGWQDAR